MRTKPPLFALRLAKSGRARCRACRAPIAKGAVALVSVVRVTPRHCVERLHHADTSCAHARCAQRAFGAGPLPARVAIAADVRADAVAMGLRMYVAASVATATASTTAPAPQSA